jgi:hypothetical protein
MRVSLEFVEQQVQRFKTSCPTSTKKAANNVKAASATPLPRSGKLRLTSQKAEPFCGIFAGRVKWELQPGRAKPVQGVRETGLADVEF